LKKEKRKQEKNSDNNFLYLAYVQRKRGRITARNSAEKNSSVTKILATIKFQPDIHI